MKVLVVGATGTIGEATVQAFTSRGDEVVAVSRTPPGTDITDPASVSALFEEVGTVDAIACTLGSAPFVPLVEATSEQFVQAATSKMLGQINVALHGLPHLSDGGSITLISGILTQHPVRNSVIAGTVNGGVEAFITSAATDLPRGIRINGVSPNVVRESLDTYGPAFPGFRPVDVADVANGFVRSAYGVETGQVFRIWD